MSEILKSVCEVDTTTDVFLLTPGWREQLTDKRQYGVFAGMELQTYLREFGLTETQFGEIVGVGQQTVNKWKRGLRTPRARQMEKIILATGGLVSADDFYRKTAAGTECAA